MEHLTLLNVFMCLVGQTVVFLSRLQSAMQKKDKAPFSMGRWVTENWIEGLLGLIGSFCGIFWMDDLDSMFGVTIEEGKGEAFWSLFCGLNGQYFISRLLNFRKT